MGRDRLVIPFAVAVTLLWLVAGFAAIRTNQVQVFIVATGPESLVLGYVFGVQLVRRAENGNA